ncbi:unnamed protein product [Discula destructiva]
MALAPPVEKDGFSYAGDALYREASNLNRHRRATIPELKAHFSGKDKDDNRPAHWYEAQLLHYGLAASKVKGTSHKRLFDAVMKGGLTVPAHIQKIEADLKKEWTKREREAKKMMKGSAATATAPSAKGTKRKADQVSTSMNINLGISLQLSNTGQVTVQGAQPATKKAKATPAVKEKKPTPAAKPSSKKVAAPQTARKTTAPQQKATALKGPKAAEKPPVKPKATPKPMARSSMATGTGAAPASAMHDPAFAWSGSNFPVDEAPPAYSEFDDRPFGRSNSNTTITNNNKNNNNNNNNSKQQQHNFSPPSGSQPKIGLLNGRYRVSCEHIEANFPEHKGDLSLIGTLDGHHVWLSFDFGVADGVIRVPRPHEADADYPTSALWRGRALDTMTDRWQSYNMDVPYRAGQFNHIYFLGGGHLRGKVRFDLSGRTVELDFDAYRLPGQPMTSEVSPSQARAEWARLG